MPNIMKDVSRELKAWLDQFLTDFETDPELISAMPIDEVRTELRSINVDTQKSRARIAKTIAAAKLKNALGDLITWMSPIWQPPWVGRSVTALDTPLQRHSFLLEDGYIEVSCRWEEQYQNKPALIRFSWEAHTTTKKNFWIRFVHPETQAIRHEACLRDNLSGEEIFTSRELNFDPVHDIWAVSMYTT